MEPIEDNLSIFLTEGDNATTEQLSAIAVVYKLGYDTAYALY